MSDTLEDWLQRLQQQHPVAIDLGLERVREVAGRMQLAPPARHVATVGGTNGKGSTVAFCEAIARAAGLRVGAYTSPHLLRYNERVRIDGEPATDAALVAAFQAVDQARGDTSLTYFEHGTLAALKLFADAGLDLVILEVGLGGRLDAVNIVDADVAVITTVDLDHQDWLGSDIEAIGREKAGIARAFKPLVLGDDDPPASVLRHAYAIGAQSWRIGCDFFAEPVDAATWRWRQPGEQLLLPMPALPGAVQLRNAACAIAALRALDLHIGAGAIAAGVAAAQLPGRTQLIERDGVRVVLDVGHNPQAARSLAQWLQSAPAGRVHAVYAALVDKDSGGVVDALQPLVDAWHLAGIADAHARSQSAQALAASLQGRIAQPQLHGDVAGALAGALAQAERGDTVLVFGSFHTVADALRALGAGPCSRAPV